MKSALHISTLIIVIFSTQIVSGQVSTATPQQTQDTELKLTNTQWRVHFVGDYVTTSGVTTIKDGAWTSIRFRPNGYYSSWHNDRIVFEGLWKVVGDHTLHMTAHSRDGWVVTFDPSFKSFKVTNLPDRTGQIVGPAPNLGPFVGRWKYRGDDVCHLREDGMAFREGPNNAPGVWRLIAPEKIEIVWDRGLYIDTFRLASNGRMLKGKSKKGLDLEATRVVNPAPKR